MIDPKRLKEKFLDIYGGETRLFRAPGRVNLIGEHTDYNGGFVLPMAIDKETAVAAAPRRDRKVKVFTVNLEESAEFDLDVDKKRENGFWLNYIEGVARILEQKNVRLTGANLLVWSDVPTGAGLSSSAALETAVGLALSEISANPIDKILLAKIGQQTEHEYVGAKVGIMDQYVSVLGRRNHALLIDCRSLEAKQVPFEGDEAAIVICNSNVKHKLANSEYNTRRAQCEEGVELLKEFIPGIIKLRDVTVKDFEKYESKLPATIRKRCRHVITENERTLNAVAILENNNLAEFGRLMWLSHASLSDDYEVSCRELDLLVEIARDCRFVLGARMTGGGFGGSTVNLVPLEFVEEFTEIITTEYKRQTNIESAVYTTGAADGAGEIVV